MSNHTWLDELVSAVAHELGHYYGYTVTVTGHTVTCDGRPVRLEPTRKPCHADPWPVLVYIGGGSPRAGAWSDAGDLAYSVACVLEGMSYASKLTPRIVEALARMRVELVVDGYATPRTEREWSALEARRA